MINLESFLDKQRFGYATVLHVKYQYFYWLVSQWEDITICNYTISKVSLKIHAQRQRCIKIICHEDSIQLYTQFQAENNDPTGNNEKYKWHFQQQVLQIFFQHLCTLFEVCISLNAKHFMIETKGKKYLVNHE